ncbi:MAG: ABC transporter permease [Candidatus Neomarinimicrobiota bacterium]|nr:ABC transporter permease [Candidatus Neomarinimicrobiota bacterium]
MNQIWKIMKWEFMNRVKTKLFLITTFALPFFMAGMMYLPTILMDMEPEDVTEIGLVYDDGLNDLLERFQTQVNGAFRLQDGNSQFQFSRFDEEQEALDSVLSKGIGGYIFIPSSVLDTGLVSYYSLSLSNTKIYSNLKRTLNQVVIEQRMLDQNIDVSLVGQLSRRIDFETFELDEMGEASEGDGLSSFLVPYLFLMILFMTVFMSGQLLLRSVMEERTSRTIEILLSSVTPDELMRGKILGLGALGMTQMIFYLAVGLSATYYKGWAAIEFSQIPIFLIYFVTGYLFYAAIFAAMGTFFTSEQEAQQSSGVISIIAVLPIAFASYFITNPGSAFTIGSSYIPPLTPFMMIIRLGTGSVDFPEIIYTTLLMVLSCWVLLKLSGKIFRTAVLLYGKKVTVKEVMKWIRA